MGKFLVLKSLYFLLFAIAMGCGTPTESSSNKPMQPVNEENHEPVTSGISFTEHDQTDYPDNPDWGFCSENYQSHYFQKGEINHLDSTFCSFHFYSEQDSLIISKINVKEWIPQAPSYANDYPSIAKLSLINQEWNRNQVRLDPRHFQTNRKDWVRVDLARNCLKTGLWELIPYVREGDIEVPQSHLWCDFPKSIYADLFNQLNTIDFDSIKNYLEEWNDFPKTNLSNWEQNNIAVAKIPIKFTDESHTMYPLEGARLKKRKEVIYPEEFDSMDDLQTDSALFATFSPPGFYNKADPRVTELGRFQTLEGVDYLFLNSFAVKTTTSLEFHFSDDKGRKTSWVIGGIPHDDLPMLSQEQANEGWKNSMGWGNHAFYESLEEHQNLDASKNPYFSYLKDKEGNWLDSHKVGMDGPVMYWDKENPDILHVWILSFERHALVGHFSLDISSIEPVPPPPPAQS